VVNAGWAGRAGGQTTWRTVVLFAAACGLLAEAFETLHVQVGGVAPPGWAVRGALFVTYALVGALLLGVALLLVRRWAVAAAATGFVLCVVLPWLNFSFLPRFGSARSLLGNAAAVVLIALVVPLLVRLRRSAVAAIALLGLVANFWPLGSGRTEDRRTGERAAPAASAPHAPPFSVMVVLIDTLRADHLGAYGYPRATSPNFDAFARDGVLFARTTAQAAWTKPSVASLMTGVFVHKHGVISSRDALGTDHATLAEEMRRRGYRTVAFSSNPWITPEFRFDRGFDAFEGGRAMGAQLTNLYKVLRRLDRALAGRGVASNVSGWALWGTNANASNSTRDKSLTDAAVEWIERQDASPFFLYVHLIGAHDPYDPPAEYVRKFRAPDWDGQVARKVPPTRVQTVFDTAAPLPEPERVALIAQYDAAVAYADAQLGRLLDALRRSGRLDSTLVVVLADHGEEFYEHRNWRHGNQLYDEVVHVPLVFRLPSRLQPARRDDLAMLVDVFPTILDLVAPSALPEGLDGRPLFAAAGGAQPAAFAEHWWFEGGTYESRIVRQGTLKLHATRDEARGRERSELYDLAGDAAEQRNLLENPGAVSENDVGELQTLLACFGDKVSVASAVSVDVDQSTKERLRQLGY
jgi:arylsulfatase A-like enzyme